MNGKSRLAKNPLPHGAGKKAEATMRIMKWVAGIAGALLLACFIGLAGYWAKNWLVIRPNPEITAYLERNRIAANLADPAEAPFPEAFYMHRVFLLGEVHGIAAAQSIDLWLLKHLNMRAGVTAYAAELDLFQARLLNHYLETGDEKALKRVFQHFLRSGLQWANREYLDKFKALRAYNLTLSPERRIRIVGMDRLQDIVLGAEALDLALTNAPGAVWPQGERLRAVLRTGVTAEGNAKDGALPVAAADVFSTMGEAPPSGIDAANWQVLRDTVGALAQRHRAESRTAAIAENVTRFLNDPVHAGAKIYGLWGMFHVLQADVFGLAPWAKQLGGTGAEFDGQIVSLTVLTVDGYMMLPNRALPSFLQSASGAYTSVEYSLDDPLLSYVTGINDLKLAAPSGPVALFDLSAKGSPFPGSDLLGSVGGLLGLLQPFNVNGASAGPRGGAQYAFLTRGSPATTPLTAQDLAD